MRKTAIVTGANRGIGFETAVLLEKNGYNVLLCSRNSSTAVEEFVKQHRETSVFICADIHLSADREKILQEVIHHFGRLDVLINNAGVAPRIRKDMLEITEQDFDYVININLKGTYFLTQSAAKLICKQDKGYIINIGSISAESVSLNRAEYCMSKSAERMMTSLFAVRLAEKNIGVFEISPGVIDTEMISTVKERYENMASTGIIPEKRLGSAEDVSKIVLAVLSGNLDYSTGTIIHCDGGLHIPKL